MSAQRILGDETLAERTSTRFALARSLITIVLVVLAAATLAGYLGEVSWVFALAAHFRLHLLGCLVIAALVAGLWQLPRHAVVAAVIALPNLVAVAPAYLAPNSPAAGGSMSLASVNVHTRSTHYADVAGYIREAAPDVVALLEVDARWAAELQARLPEYRHGLWQVRPDNFGIALVSRTPLRRVEALQLTSESTPAILATVALGGREVQILALHPVPPINAARTGQHRAQLEAAAELVSKLGARLIVVGDLNTSPWSAAFARLTAAGLSDTRHGFGHQASWPVWLGRFGIPIDHCLVGPGLHTHERRVGPDVGSDHFPLYVEVSVD